MTEINISNNNISVIPEWILSLNLSILKVSKNKINIFNYLNKPIYLNIEDNPIKNAYDIIFYHQIYKITFDKQKLFRIIEEIYMHLKC